MVDAVVTFSKYGWVGPDGLVLRANKGEVIEVTQDQLDAGIAEGSLAVPGDEGEKPIASMNGKELDAKADELGVEDWDEKAKVADKKVALAAWIAANPAD